MEIDCKQYNKNDCSTKNANCTWTKRGCVRRNGVLQGKRYKYLNGEVVLINEDLFSLFDTFEALDLNIKPVKSEYLGEGGYGITFIPAFPCSNGQIYPKSLGKIFLSEESALNEWSISERIKKIEKGTTQKYFTYPKELCYVDSQEAMSQQPELLRFWNEKSERNNVKQIPKEFPQLVMDYSGMTLSKYMNTYYKSSKIKRADFIYILQNLFYATRRLIDHGYVHQDIKSANIVVSNKERLRLIDFGLTMDKVEYYDPYKNWLMGGKYYYVSAPEYDMYLMPYDELEKLTKDKLIETYADGDKYLSNLLKYFTYELNNSADKFKIKEDLLKCKSQDKRIRYYVSNYIYKKSDIFSIGLMILRFYDYLIPSADDDPEVVKYFKALMVGMLSFDPNERVSIDNAITIVEFICKRANDPFKINKDLPEVSKRFLGFGKSNKLKSLLSDIKYLSF